MDIAEKLFFYLQKMIEGGEKLQATTAPYSYGSAYSEGRLDSYRDVCRFMVGVLDEMLASDS